MEYMYLRMYTAKRVARIKHRNSKTIYNRNEGKWK